MSSLFWRKLSKMKKGLICGPWIGEFGWELFSWQSFCRSASSRFDYTVVIGRTGHDYLYEDFCDKYYSSDPPPEGVAESYKNSAVRSINEPQFVIRDLADIKGEEAVTKMTWTWLQPEKIGNPPYDHPHATVEIPGIGLVKPNYALYRGSLDSSDEMVDIVIHARNRKIRSHENWSVEKWTELVSTLGDNVSVGCIGTLGGAFLIEGARDYRGIPLKKATGLLRHAKCIVGPSSGPMHLASLSGCPQVWWTDNPNKNFPRYTYMWNPFNTKSLMVLGKDPSVEEVKEKILQIQ